MARNGRNNFEDTLKGWYSSPLMLKFILRLFLLCLITASCGQGNHRLKAQGFKLVKAFPKLSFIKPVDLQSARRDHDHLYVLEQDGIIYSFVNSPVTAEKKVFLDIREKVFKGHMEEGLLGLAFHPSYKENGYFYIFYSANPPRRSVVARFQRSKGDPTLADPNSEMIIIEQPQPFGNHKGGQLAFGPDGYLYIALGDGGGAGDPFNNAQNLKSLLGSILRLDIDHPSQGRNFGIPSDNPFAGNTSGTREEIYAYGLRNPWRFSFDPVTKGLWAADVGQDKPFEEINIIEKGKNYGWHVMEGSHCFDPPVACKREGLELPLWEYSMDEGRSVTGGYVYRGHKLSSLTGYYIYGDFVSGRLWALSTAGRKVVRNKELLHNPDLYPTSFGLDSEGELYICSFDGYIYRLEES